MSEPAYIDILSLLNGKESRFHKNLPPAALVEESLHRGEAMLTSTGALRATTEAYTGRSPKDKYIVEDNVTRGIVDWGKVNQPIAAATFDRLLSRLVETVRDHDLFVFDGYAGASPDYGIPIRIITEFAWHSLFAHQLFIRPTIDQLAAHTPQFTLIDAPSFLADPRLDGTNSEAIIALDLTRGIGLIGGTQYAGEIKKSIFTVLNYLLPQRGVFPMHCSANTGPADDAALFFGLSGTGKTTLSADPERRLIGDDEHGWSDNGIFNFEGGCYAKCVRLRYHGEPQIWNAIRFGAVLENVVIYPETRIADYDDTHLTENTRVAYPIDFIPNALIPSVGGHPKTILFLTADAFGVLPPISRLTRPQAMYHFLSGYTSKLAGTERGVTTPEPNFSACFGAPFWPLSPLTYAHMLGERLEAHAATCYLVNTGWSGGGYGAGHRIDLAHTRAMVHAALRGELAHCAVRVDPIFGLQVPEHIPGVPDQLLDPRATWSNPSEYDAAAAILARRFAENFRRFGGESAEIQAAGPRVPQ